MLIAGVIGLGVGEAHVEAYRKHLHCKVKTVCDFSNEKIQAFKGRYPDIGITMDAQVVLEDPDISVVSIASYDNYHHDQIITAIEHGKHVFVEKPLCLYESEARHIKETLAKHPRLRLSSNLILRKSPRFVQLKEMIEAGILGKVYYIEADYNYGRIAKLTQGWRSQIPFYSVIYGGGVHMVDLLLWLTGERVEEVCSYGNKVATQATPFRFNDMTVSLLRLSGDCIAKVAVNFGCIHPHFHHLAVYGTSGTFLNSTKDFAFYYDSRDPDVPPKKISTPYHGTHKGEVLASFLNSLIDGRPEEIASQEVFDSMAVCFAMEKATKETGNVPVYYI